MEDPPATGPNPAPSSCRSKSWAETWHPASTPLSGLGVPPGDIHRHRVKPQGIAHPTSPCALPQNAGAKQAEGLVAIWQGDLVALGPGYRLAITAEPFQLP